MNQAVNSLKEAMRNYDLFNCISRGENQKYEYHLRSGPSSTFISCINYLKMVELIRYDKVFSQAEKSLASIALKSFQ